MKKCRLGLTGLLFIFSLIPAFGQTLSPNPGRPGGDLNNDFRGWLVGQLDERNSATTTEAVFYQDLSPVNGEAGDDEIITAAASGPAGNPLIEVWRKEQSGFIDAVLIKNHQTDWDRGDRHSRWWTEVDPGQAAEEALNRSGILTGKRRGRRERIGRTIAPKPEQRAAAFKAQAPADFSDVVCFGDSLTNNDLLWIVNGTSPNLYGKDPMEAAFAKGAADDDELSSYAIAGSVSEDVKYQIDFYEFYRNNWLQAGATLFNFEIGGNDLRYNIDLLAAYPPGANAKADAVIHNIFLDMGSDLLRLHRSHPHAQFIIWTLPDITLSPEGYEEGFTETEIANIHEHTKRLNRKIRSWDRYRFVVILDLYRLSQDSVTDPPIVHGHEILPPPDYGHYDNLFADQVHPTAVTNAMIANAIIEAINHKWDDHISTYSEDELADLAHIWY